MTLANMAPETHATELPERTTGEAVRPWQEFEYARLVADSDRILADALTPQAVVLLHRVGTVRAGVRHPAPPVSPGWTVSAVPAPQIRATQRSPPSPRHTRPRHARADRIVRDERRKEC